MFEKLKGNHCGSLPDEAPRLPRTRQLSQSSRLWALSDTPGESPLGIYWENWGEREVRSPKVDSKVEDETRLLIWTKIIKNIFGGRRLGLGFTLQYCLWFILFCFVLQEERGGSLSC